MKIVLNLCPKQGKGGVLVGRFIGNKVFLLYKSILVTGQVSHFALSYYTD
jgi:hypothetical protein